MLLGIVIFESFEGIADYKEASCLSLQDVYPYRIRRKTLECIQLNTYQKLLDDSTVCSFKSAAIDPKLAVGFLRIDSVTEEIKTVERKLEVKSLPV